MTSTESALVREAEAAWRAMLLETGRLGALNVWDAGSWQAGYIAAIVKARGTAYPERIMS